MSALEGAPGGCVGAVRGGYCAWFSYFHWFLDGGRKSKTKSRQKSPPAKKGRLCTGSIDSSWVLERQLTRISTQVTQETTSTKNARRGRPSPSCRDPALCPGPSISRKEPPVLKRDDRAWPPRRLRGTGMVVTFLEPRCGSGDVAFWTRGKRKREKPRPM